MKKTKTLVLGMAFAMLLSACQSAGGGGDDGNKDVIFKLTFHQQTVANDTVVDVIKGKTTNADVKAKEPEIVAREGYTSKWQYDVTSMTADLTIEPTYTAIIYQATYKIDGSEVAKLPFTVEDTKVKNEDKIETGVEQGYKVVWGDYTIGAHDMVVNGEVEAIEYTATFKVDGASIGTVEFSRDDMDAGSTSFPADKLLPIPEDKKEQYFDVYWEDVDLTEIRSVDINLVKEPHQYSAKLVDEDGDEVETLEFHYDKNSTSFVWTSKTPDDVAVPASATAGYDGAWESKALAGEDCVIHPTYTAHTYTASFMDGETLVDTRPFTVEDEEIANVPDVPEHVGMDGAWEEYEIAAEDLTINANYVLHQYFIDYMNGEDLVETVPYNIETESYDEVKANAPDAPSKTGYTGSWDDASVELTYSDTHIAVQPKYTANKYKVTLPSGDELQATYDATYDLSAKADYFNQLYYGEDLVPLKGTYKFDHDIVLTKGPSRLGFEDFESIEAINGLVNLSKSTVKQMTVKDGVGVNGSKGLEVEGFYGDKGIYFTKQYLDMVFAKPEIMGLNFDFKGEVECNNFRHRSYHRNAAGEIQTNQDGSPKAANITYFNGINGTGLATHWQTAQFTRAMYNELCENPEFDGGHVIFGTTGDTDHRKIWIDNLKPVTFDDKADVANRLRLNEASYPINTSGNDILIKDAYTNKNIIKIFSADAKVSSVSFDTVYKTEGLSSLHIVRDNSDFNFGIQNSIIDNAIAAGYDGIEFDIMLDHVVGPGNMLKFTNRTSSTQSGYGVFDTYTWYPIKAAFNDIRDCGDGDKQDYLFNLQNNGADAKDIHNIWIDNIRPYKSTPSFAAGTTVLESFEDNNIIKVCSYKGGTTELDSVYWEAGLGNYSDNGEHPITTLGHDNYRDRGLSNYWFNTARADKVSASRCVGSIDTAHASNGCFAFKLSVTHNDGSMAYSFIPKNVATALGVGDKVLIDVYTEVEGQSFGNRINGGKRDAQPLTAGTWTTIEIEKTAADDSNFHRFSEGSLAKGDYWFDNLRVVKAA